MARPMNSEQAVARHSVQLLMRALILVTLGMLAIAKPDTFFLDALVAVCAVAIVFGGYEMTIHGTSSDGLRYGRIAFLDGLATVAFGAVSILLTFTRFGTGMIVLAAWLCLYALVLFSIAGYLRLAAGSRSALRGVSMARWVLGSVALLHVAGAIGALYFSQHPRLGSLVLPGSGAMYVIALGVWSAVCGWWLRQSIGAWSEVPAIETNDDVAEHRVSIEVGSNMGSTTSAQVLVISAALLSACAPVLSNVAVRGDSGSVSQLVGQWEGEYRSEETGRNGFITFKLRAGADTAQGDVIMTYRMARASVNSSAEEYARVLSPSMQVLTIRFVRAEDDEVLGILDPYTDPVCGCPLTTRFRGRLRGDEIRGTYETRPAEIFHKPTTGEWSAKRVPVGAAASAK